MPLASPPELVHDIDMSTGPYSSLDDALSALIQCLNLFVPLRLWAVTRVQGKVLTVLYAEDKQREETAGQVFSVTNSYCSRMAEGEGPRFAPKAQAIPAYRDAQISCALQLGTYIGQPLVSEDGVQVGTLCAVGPEEQDIFTPEQVCLIQTVTRAMSTLISTARSLEQARVTAAKLRYLAERDALTGLSNRHRWEEAMVTEEAALKALGENALVMLIDLDGLKPINDRLGHAEGDRYIVSCAIVLREALREHDVVARIGGDEFAVLVRGLTKEQGAALKERVSEALTAAGVQASVGYAMRLAHGSLTIALAHADANMYETKVQRKMAKLSR